MYLPDKQYPSERDQFDNHCETEVCLTKPLTPAVA